MNQSDQTQLMPDSPESDPDVILCRAQCAEIAARQVELRAELKALDEQLAALGESDELPPDPRADAMAVLRGGSALGGLRKTDVQRKRFRVGLDLATLETFANKAQLAVGNALRVANRKRAQRADVVAAMRTVAAAIAQLEAANDAARLLSRELNAKGFSDFGWGGFTAMTLHTCTLAEWLKDAEPLCGTNLT